MFPNIPREFGIEECKKHLDKRPAPHFFSTSSMIEALKITLDNNLATFNGICYKQTSGTAMGPKNACDYADVAMNYIDQAVHNNNPETIPNPHIPKDWSRFRDDVYIPWTKTVEELMEFMDWLNNIHTSLKFTVCHSVEGIEFLDLFVYCDENNNLCTKLYSKSSDTHCYLVPSSCHKTHIIENIPFNTARRVFQNNSHLVNYEKDKIVYSKHLTNRGYNEKFVKEAFEKAEKLDRRSLYAVKTDNKNSKLCLPLVIDTNPALPDMSKIINKFKYIIELDPKLAKIIPPSSLFVSHRASKNLKSILISSKLPKGPAPPRNTPATSILEIRNESNPGPSSPAIVHNMQSVPNPEHGIHSCNKCYLCINFLQLVDSFTSFHTDQVFKHKSKLTCNSECIIYLTDCITHKISYTGYTTTNMKTRFSNNKSHFKKDNASCELIKHLLTCEHEGIDFTNRHTYDKSLSKHIKVTLIEQVRVEPGDSKEQKEAKCEAREGYWQTQLKTLQTYGGLNKRDNRKYVSKRKQEAERIRSEV